MVMQVAVADAVVVAVLNVKEVVEVMADDEGKLELR